MCFYLSAQYQSAIQFYEARIRNAGPVPSLSTRESYAQSLFGIGDAVSAIRVLHEVEQGGIPTTSRQADNASYRNAILSLAQILFANGEFRAAASAAQRLLVLRPDSTQAYEVLLAAVIEIGGAVDIDLHSLYCDVRRIQLENISDDPEGIRGELAELEILILNHGGSIVCH